MAIYKRGREFELGTTEHKSSKWPGWDSNPGPPDCESDELTTRPRCLPVVDNTQCTQVEKEVNGTMIQLYEFNPNTAGITGIDSRLIFASITVIGIVNGLK